MTRGSNRASNTIAATNERELRVQLAACYRLVAHFGMDDLIYNHISVRLPGPDIHFLINPYGLLYSEITASSLVKIGIDGDKIDPSPHEVNLAGFVIHSAIHAGRADAHCVMHMHSDAATAVSALEDGLLPVSQFAMRYQNRIGFHAYEGLAFDLNERQRLVRDLGPHQVLLMRNHGILTVGRSIPEAFILSYYFERAARVQLQAQAALAVGGRLVQPSSRVIDKSAHQFNDNEGDVLPAGTREWPALIRLLDRIDPAFRD